MNPFSLTCRRTRVQIKFKILAGKSPLRSHNEFCCPGGGKGSFALTEAVLQCSAASCLNNANRSCINLRISAAFIAPGFSMSIHCASLSTPTMRPRAPGLSVHWKRRCPRMSERIWCHSPRNLERCTMFPLLYILKTEPVANAHRTSNDQSVLSVQTTDMSFLRFSLSLPANHRLLRRSRSFNTPLHLKPSNMETLGRCPRLLKLPVA